MLQKASRKQMKAKIGIFGESASGKSLQALRVAQGLCGGLDRVVVIDTENRLGIHIHRPEWNGEVPFVIDVSTNYSPIKIVEALQECFKEGVDCVIIDTITSVYNHAGGMIEIANSFRNAKGTKDTRAGWGEANGKYNALIEQIKNAPCHIIAVMRGVEKVVDEDLAGYGKSKKFAIEPQMKKEFIFDLQLSFLISRDTHLALAVKDNTELFSESTLYLTEETGKQIKEWCNDGIESKSSLREKIDYHILQIRNLCADDDAEILKFNNWIKPKTYNEKLLDDLTIMFNRKIKALSDQSTAPETPAPVQDEILTFSDATNEKLAKFRQFASDERITKLEQYLATKPDEVSLIAKLEIPIAEIDSEAQKIAEMVKNGQALEQLMQTFDTDNQKLLNHPLVINATNGKN